MTITIIECANLSDIDHALTSSWSGFNIRAIYLGKTYDLYLDTTSGERHEELMAIVCPSIKVGMSVNEILNLYDATSCQLGLMKGWQDFESYSTTQVN